MCAFYIVMSSFAKSNWSYFLLSLVQLCNLCVCMCVCARIFFCLVYLHLRRCVCNLNIFLVSVFRCSGERSCVSTASFTKLAESSDTLFTTNKLECSGIVLCVYIFFKTCLNSKESCAIGM